MKTKNAFPLLKRYKQFQKCYDDSRHYHCVDCNDILDNLPVFNLDKGEEIGQGHNYLFIDHGIIYHHDLNGDLDAHRIDRFTPEQIEDEE